MHVHVTVMIVSEDKGKFADEFMTCFQEKRGATAAALADGCTAATFSISFDI